MKNSEQSSESDWSIAFLFGLNIIDLQTAQRVVELGGHVLHLRLTALVQQKVGLAARLTLLLPVGNSTKYKTDVN